MTALARRIVLFLVLNALVLNGLLWAVSPPGFKDTVLRHTADFFQARSGGDSWLVMSIAYDHMGWPHAKPLYSEIFFDQRVKFQYPPASLFAIAAMRMAGIDRVRTAVEYVGRWPSINDVLGWTFILLMIVSVAALFHHQLRQSNVPAEAGISFTGCLLIAAVAALTFYPVMKAYTLGQIQVWLNSIFALSLLCWATERKVASGVLIGLMCAIKPHFALFLVWGLIRAEWRLIVAGGATILTTVAASVAAYGWADHVDYLQVVAHIAARGEAYFPNQSINGLLNRLMSISDPVSYNNLEFRMNDFPPFTPWVYATTFVTSSAILLCAIAWRSKHEGRVFDFCRMAVSLTIASPIAWEHHYGILLPVFAVLLADTIGDRCRILWLMVSCVLVSNFIPATNLLAATPFNVGQSYLLAGALIALALLYLGPAAIPVTAQEVVKR